MPSFKTTILALLAATATAMPATVRLTPRQMQYHSLAKRQQEKAAAAGLSDFDILQFALTLEHLESNFYRQGLARFPASDFAALGINEPELNDIQQIGQIESQHVSLLQSSLAQGGVQPVQPCNYNFGFTDAAGMLQTAAVLENTGVSAYLSAAMLLSDKATLGVASSILTVEARHQSSIRFLSKQSPVPQAVDAALSPRAVFSLAAPFIESCPDGSNLKIEPFPKLTMMDNPPAAAAEGVVGGNSTGVASTSSKGASSSMTLSVGSEFRVQAEDGSESTATGCGFTSGSETFFSEFKDGKCNVPENVAGVTYITLTKETPLDGKLVDDNVVAGPMAVIIT